LSGGRGSRRALAALAAQGYSLGLSAPWYVNRDKFHFKPRGCGLVSDHATPSTAGLPELASAFTPATDRPYQITPLPELSFLPMTTHRYNTLMRFRLPTLLIISVLGPPLLAWAWTTRGELKAMAASGLDTLPRAVVTGLVAIFVAGLAAALTVEATTAAINQFHRRS
jgi:hypothetical protein